MVQSSLTLRVGVGKRAQNSGTVNNPAKAGTTNSRNISPHSPFPPLPNPQSLIPNPQSLIPNPFFPLPRLLPVRPGRNMLQKHANNMIAGHSGGLGVEGRNDPMAQHRVRHRPHVFRGRVVAAVENCPGFGGHDQADARSRTGPQPTISLTNFGAVSDFGRVARARSRAKAITWSAAGTRRTTS